MAAWHALQADRMRNGFDTEDEDLLLRLRDEFLNLGKTLLLLSAMWDMFCVFQIGCCKVDG